MSQHATVRCRMLAFLMDQSTPYPFRVSKHKSSPFLRSLMAQFFIFLSIVTIYASPEPQADTPESLKLEDILDKYFAVQGGIESVNNIRSMRLEGTLLQDKKEHYLLQFRKKPNRQRTQIGSQPYNTMWGFNGEIAWFKNPTMQRATRLSPRNSKKISQNSQVLSHLVDLQDQPVALKLIGLADVEETLCYHIQARLENGKIINYYISRKENRNHFVYKRRVRSTRNNTIRLPKSPSANASLFSQDIHRRSIKQPSAIQKDNDQPRYL